MRMAEPARLDAAGVTAGEAETLAEIGRLDAGLPVFRQAGDVHRIARTFLELARPSMTADPVAAAALLFQRLPVTTVASEGRAGGIDLITVLPPR